MTIFNKKIILEYNYPRILLIAQNIASVIFILFGSNYIVKYLNSKSSSNLDESGKSLVEILSSYLKMNPIESQHLIYCIPISLSYLFMLISSLYALNLVSVATVVVFRNFATFLVAIGDFFIFGKRFSKHQLFALLTIGAGVVIYAYNDLEGDFNGYIWIILNTLAVVLNSLLEKYVTVNISQTAIGISLYQNMVSTVLLIIFVTVLDGWGNCIQDFINIDISRKVMFFLTCIFGTTIGVSYFTLNKFESPTSITVAGNMNKLLSVILSYFVFESIYTMESTFGLTVSIIGGLYYSISSIQSA